VAAFAKCQARQNQQKVLVIITEVWSICPSITKKSLQAVNSSPNHCKISQVCYDILQFTIDNYQEAT